MKKIKTLKWIILIVIFSLSLSQGCKKKPQLTNIEYDLIPPSLVSVTVGDTTDQTAVIYWRSDESALVSAEYGTSTAYGSSVAGIDYGIGGSCQLTGLSKSTTYHVRLRASDAAGNVSYSADYSFTTSGSLFTIVITPSAVTKMLSEDVNNFIAAGKDAGGKTVIINPEWSLANNLGILSNTTGTNVTFTAGDSLGTDTLTATDQGVTANASIAITGGVFPPPPEDGVIYKTTGTNSSELLAEYEIGVNTGHDATNWLNENQADWTDTHDYMKLAYPGDSLWGAAFMVVKPVTSIANYTERNAFNYTTYTSLSIELKGETGSEQVKIGIKDINDPDDGNEVKYFVTSIAKDWQTIEMPLSQFISADRANLKRLYVVIEFVWDTNGMDPLLPRTIYFRNIKYVR